MLATGTSVSYIYCINRHGLQVNLLTGPERSITYNMGRQSMVDVSYRRCVVHLLRPRLPEECTNSINRDWGERGPAIHLNNHLMYVELMGVLKQNSSKAITQLSVYTGL